MASPVTKKLSMSSRSLRPQLMIAFCLMSIIPILALLNFVFPSLLPRNFLLIIVGVVILLSLLGFIVVKRIIDPIITINSEIKVIANGELSRQINISRQDEIGELSKSLNQLTTRIKSNMDELKIYGERTKDINLQINRQVIALNGLLQISNLITKNANLKDIFDITISKLAQMAQSSMAVLILKKQEGFEVSAQYGISQEAVSGLSLSSQSGVLYHALAASKPYLKIDEAAEGGMAEELLHVLAARNLMIYPILVQGRPQGLMMIGNLLEKFRYSNEDVELMSIFAKQLSIALENDFLAHKVKDLEVKDSLTGLFNKRYILMRFEEEILRAISLQQPCSLVVVVLSNLGPLRQTLGETAADEALVKVAALLKGSIRQEIDRVARLEEGVFCLVVPQKNKRQAEHMTNEIKEKLTQAFQDADPHRRLTFNVSVVENPIDGADARLLLKKALETAGAGKAADTKE